MDRMGVLFSLAHAWTKESERVRAIENYDFARRDLSLATKVEKVIHYFARFTAAIRPG
jgi:hypothetical protein